MYTYELWIIKVLADITGSDVSYQGCYKDDAQSRDLDHKIQLSGVPNSPQSCMGECAALSYSYAGLQVIIIIIIIIIIIFKASWDKPSRHEDIRKKVKITNCNRLAGSERALEWDRISPL